MRPIVVVYGHPINVPLESVPSTTTVDRVHAEYIRAVERIYESNKHKYGDKSKSLNIL
jgi:hypothetical protein